MARPTQHRTITKRVRLNENEHARLMADAAEVTNGDFSELARRRMLDGKPMITGKGMSRPELMECLELATTLQNKFKGLDTDGDRCMRDLTDTLYKALRRDL